MMAVPVNRPLLDGDEKRALVECIESGWISSEGPLVAEFEATFADRMGRKHGIAVSNGSSALDVAVAALRLGPGDEVILPAHTIISCAQAISRAGAVPVPVDCDPHTYNMTPSAVAGAVTPRTRAIMVVHIFGLSVDIGPILELAESHGIAVIEDAAEAHGQTWRGRPCGSFGALSAFSFYANKLVTTGEGGMVLTDDGAMAERCRSLRNLCFTPSQRFVHEELGWNFRMTSMQAALGLTQLKRLDSFIERKRRMGRFYTEHLQSVPGLQLPIRATDWAENIYWVYPIALRPDVPFDAAEAMRRFADKGIGTRPFFWPIHRQPVFQKLGWFQDVSLPVSEDIARRGFYIPSGLGLTQEEMDYVVEVTKAIFA